MRGAVSRRRSHSRTTACFRPAVVLPTDSLATSPRLCATPLPSFPGRVAFGAAPRCGCAAPRFLPHPILQFPCLRQYKNFQQVPPMLLTIAAVSPLLVANTGASLRDRAALPSPVPGLVPSGGYPSRLHSLRSLRGPLARRFAALTAACLSAAAVRRARIRVLTQPCSPLAFASLALAGCAGLGLRLGSSALEFAIATLLPPRRGPTAHAPRRLPSGSGPGTVFPNVRYPGSGLLYALRRLGSHTPRSWLQSASQLRLGYRFLRFRRQLPPSTSWTGRI